MAPTDEVQDALSKAWDFYQAQVHSHASIFSEYSGWQCACGWSRPGFQHTSKRSVRQHITMAERKASKAHNAEVSAILQP